MENLVKKTSVIILINFFIISLASHVTAETEQNSDEWQFALSPLFLWGMNVNGTQQIGSTVAPLELNFTDDILVPRPISFDLFSGNLIFYAASAIS